MSDRKLYLLVILACSFFIGALVFFTSYVICEDKELIELQKEKIKPEIKQLHDTTAIQMYKYPSGATGSLRFDWMTGEKGKLIEK